MSIASCKASKSFRIKPAESKETCVLFQIIQRTMCLIKWFGLFTATPITCNGTYGSGINYQMRILYATQWFEPEPILKGIYFAKLLQGHGHDVQVVTGFPNYPGGNIYPGYRLRWFRQDVMDGVPIDRVFLYPSHSRSALGRALNYLSFSISLTIYGLSTRKRPDVLYAYHPPLTVGLAAALIAAVRRIPLIYDIQDMWPDTLVTSGMFSNRTALNFVGWLCRLVYHRADRIIVQSPGFKLLLVERGVPATKINLIYNWANEMHAWSRQKGGRV